MLPARHVSSNDDIEHSSVLHVTFKNICMFCIPSCAAVNQYTRVPGYGRSSLCLIVLYFVKLNFDIRKQLPLFKYYQFDHLHI